MPMQLEAHAHARAYAAVQHGLSPSELFTRHMSLVKRLAWHVGHRYSQTVEVEDLAQVGMVALLEASRTYEPHEGAAFSTYANVRVRGAMLDEVRRRVAGRRGTVQRQREFTTARQQCIAELGRPPTEGELAARLGLTPLEFVRLHDSAFPRALEDIDNPAIRESPALIDEDPNPFENLERRELAELLHQHLAQLPPREAQVLNCYYMLEMNLAEIGEVFGITVSRVCQIKSDALKRLRSSLRNGGLTEAFQG